MAAALLWRDIALVKPLLAIAALVTGILAAAAVDGPSRPLEIANLAASSVIAVGALRVRIPAGRSESERDPRDGRPATTERAQAFDRPGETGESIEDDDPPQGWDDPAEDTVLLRFMDRAAHLDREETRALGGAWQAIAQADRDRAWARVRTLLRRTRRERLMGDVAEEIERWGRAQGGSPWTWEFGTMTDVDRSDIRRAAMPALLDAAAAVILRDALDSADRDVLVGPWEAIVSGTSDLR
jgi:hypothetical protein